MTDHLKELSEAGVSIWLDDLSRERLETGNLADLVKNDHVVGVTTNPSIFAAALADGERYDDQVRKLAAEGADVDQTVFALTTTDVRNACDVLKPVFDATNGVDGRVSIEVAPDLAFDTDATLASAKELWKEVDRENLFIKIPATTEGAPAISDALAEGISINVTLIFGLDRYQGGHGRLRSPAWRRPSTRGWTSRRSTRSRRSSSRASTPRSTTGSTRPAPPTTCWARPASPTPGSPTRPTRSSSPATGGTSSPPPEPTASVRCGRRPA